MRKLLFIGGIFVWSFSAPVQAQSKKNFVVAGYYSGNNLSQIDSFAVEKLTHIIFSFCHLKGPRLSVDNATDTAVIQKLVRLKNKAPALKILLSLGGWGGCETCSDVFSTKENREVFSRSVKELNSFFGTDGIDLDWEYPSIVGFPGHKYQPADKQNFTSLLEELRKTLGDQNEISFAAGGFNQYIDSAVEWGKVMKLADRVHLMTYDLVNGYSTTTGHHTPLYSTTQQTESTDNAVQKLFELNVPKEKIVIGAAFYGRVWEGVPGTNFGLYQQGKFQTSIPFKDFGSQLSSDNGFIYHWDGSAMSPYLYNPEKSLFVTYDDPRSIEMKTRYAIEKGLGGIMFWELTSDVYSNGLLDAIDRAKRTYLKQ